MYKDINIYRELYNLPELTHKEGVDFDFFRLCKRDYKFAVICIYNEKREFLLIRDINKNIGWELVGGYIGNNERLEDAVNRIVLKEVGLFIDELQPIALVNNNFEYNGNVISHFGIAFIALTRGGIKSQPENIKIVYTKEIPDKMAFQDKKILKIAKQKIEEKIYNIPQEEIVSSKKFFLLYFLNKYFVQEIIGNFASRKIQKKILQLIIGNPKSIIDVSCGDSNLIFELGKVYHPEICVANDISWKLISLIKNKAKKGNIIFTNHNVLDLPFTRTFDLIVFKNTLHHTPSELKVNLLQKLSSLSKQLIIVDIDDPYQSNFLTKIWHWYYKYFLGDKGHSFLTFQKFKEVIKENIKDKKITFGTINTIKGRYFYASLYGSLEDIEVEIKVGIDSSQIRAIREKLLALGAIFKEKIKETDIYFTSLYRDFIKSKECLRIRKREGNGYKELTLTYKGPTTKSMEDKKQFWKKEINIPIHCSKEEIELLLETLNFKKIVEVKKEREKFTLGRQEITIDEVENAGWFLEVENNIENLKEKEKALHENIILVEGLGIDKKNIIGEPYRDLVLNENG